jgi:hypothetical protein
MNVFAFISGSITVAAELDRPRVVRCCLSADVLLARVVPPMQAVLGTNRELQFIVVENQNSITQILASR